MLIMVVCHIELGVSLGLRLWIPYEDRLLSPAILFQPPSHKSGFCKINGKQASYVCKGKDLLSKRSLNTLNTLSKEFNELIH